MSELTPQNFTPAKLKRWLDTSKKEERVDGAPLPLILETIYEAQEVEETDLIDDSHHETEAETDETAEEGDEMDQLLMDVQKEIHTRYKNMFEGDMLLPNLEFNPEFEGKLDANLLSLEELMALFASSQEGSDYLLSLAQQQAAG